MSNNFVRNLLWAIPAIIILAQDRYVAPGITAGTGLFSLMGDLSTNKRDNIPFVSRPGMSIGTYFALGKAFILSATYVSGTTGGNIYTASYFYNYRTRIVSVGAELLYNFYHLQKNKYSEGKVPLLSPLLGFTVRSNDFLVKTDLKGINGEQYYWWSDGTIRDKPEGALDSRIITRDYATDNDIHKIHLAGNLYYPERTWGVGAVGGFQLNISSQVAIQAGLWAMYPFSDYLDGVSSKTRFPVDGDNKNDILLFPFLRLNIMIPQLGLLFEGNKPLTSEELIQVGLTEDGDGDGVYDLLDECPGTPFGARVDTKGCPLDSDGDGVPDYMDLEPGTMTGAIVDDSGRAIPDSLVALMKTRGIDEENLPVIRRGTVTSQTTKYFLKIGTISSGIPPSIAYHLLSNPEIRTISSGDSIIIAYGSYDDLPQMLKDKVKMTEEGITWVVPSEISYQSPEEFLIKEYMTVGARYARRRGVSARAEAGESIIEISRIPVTKEPVFRVQLGAFRRPVSQRVFAGIGDVSAFRFEDGLIRYYSRAFTSYREAAKYKAELLSMGFRGIFIVAFKDGKKISLREAGVERVDTALEAKSYAQNLSIAPEKVRYRVQYGAFKKEISAELLEKLLKMGNVEKFQEKDFTRYVSQPFRNLGEARQMAQKAREAGLTDAFVVGEFNGRIITLQELREIVKEVK